MEKTPLQFSPGLSTRFDCEVWLKLETNNPTGSHKDRESAKIIQHCLANGIKEIGCASTGNFAVSLAYYAFNNRLKCHVWLNRETVSPETLAYIEAFQAQLHLEDDELDAIYRKSSEHMQRHSIFNANPGSCPAKVAANCELGLEIRTQLPHVEQLVCPVNNGSHIIGVAEAMEGTDIAVNGVLCHSHFASSISGFHCNEGAVRVEEAVIGSGGQFVEATETDLRNGMRALQDEGILAEISSAAVIGVLPKLSRISGKRVCCVVTASGLKKPYALREFFNAAPTAR